VDVLSRVSHRNLVLLIGYCLEDDQQMLIYEYMHKGSLYDHLYGDLSTSANEQLDWTTRLHIALNASQGLEYLHSGCNPIIIHSDVKTKNILLPSDMKNGKVADFGLSRLIYGENITHVTTNVKGTVGYLDPKYFTSECLSIKSDVYSFGVVLLEIISGRKAIDTMSLNREALNLCDWETIDNPILNDRLECAPLSWVVLLRVAVEKHSSRAVLLQALLVVRVRLEDLK
ncbi:unnamed protein product, partial [Sphagnum jensenii]